MLQTNPLRFISLFAGIGGIDLGLERAGMQCVAQVEIDDYATRVLAKHWPDVPRFRDVREVGGYNLPQADVLAGGFPCQDISDAGKRAGLAGARSGLWWEFHRLIEEVQPSYVIAENVAALRYRELDTVLRSLAEIGYDAEWQTLSAAACGAPHRRERIFLVAYATSQRRTTCVFRPVLHLPSQPALYSRTWNGHRVDQPAIIRVVDGIPRQLDRLRGLGNAVVPQVAELVGRAVVAHYAAQHTRQQLTMEVA